MTKYFVLIFITGVFSCKYNDAKESGKKCSIYEIENLILNLEEVNEKRIFIDSISNKTKGISLHIDSSKTTDKLYYMFNVGYNNSFRFENYFTFYVSKNECSKILVYEKRSDQILTLEEWRDNNPRIKTIHDKIIRFPITNESLANEKRIAVKTKTAGKEEYTCGEDTYECYFLKESTVYKALIINSSCYDFEYKDLVILDKADNIISKILIAVEMWDVEKKETKGTEDKKITSFVINENYNIIVKTINSLDRKVVSSATKKYRITEEGKIVLF